MFHFQIFIPFVLSFLIFWASIISCIKVMGWLIFLDFLFVHYLSYYYCYFALSSTLSIPLGFKIVSWTLMYLIHLQVDLSLSCLVYSIYFESENSCCFNSQKKTLTIPSSNVTYFSSFPYSILLKYYKRLLFKGQP